MELLNILWSFLGTGAALLIGGAALKKLSTWFVEQRLEVALKEHQHRLDTKLARLEADLGRVTDVISRRNEREFSVVETAWDLMIRAVGDAQGKFGSMHYGPPDFTKMAQAEVERVVDAMPFAPEEKKALLQTDSVHRIDLCRKLMLTYGAREARRAWGEFKNHLSTRQIFMSPSIHTQFVSVQNELSEILSTAEAYAELGMEIPTEDRVEINKKLHGTINGTIDTLGANIRTRFGFDDETAPAHT